MPSRAIRDLTTRPEAGALAGALAVFVFFAFAAGGRGFLTVDGTVNYLQVAAEIGILAVPVAMLMIAGDFDLSVGSTLGATAVTFGYLLSRGWSTIPAALVAAALAVLIGLVNGILVVRTRMPSFIITLATMYIVRGLTIALTLATLNTTTIQGATGFDGTLTPLQRLFGGTLFRLPASVYWWIGLTAVGAWVLSRTVFGNWTYATGGDLHAARSLGVRTDRVRIALFVCTALAACLIAIIQVISTSSADVLRGNGIEFQAITAAVIGGTLLTGGYGSVIGAWFGALAFGIVSQGIFFTNIDANWFQAFLGTMLLAAVAINHFVRTRAMKVRR